MLPSSIPVRWFARAVLACVAAASAQAQLAPNSPFLAPQASGPGPTQGAPLEYRGYMVTKEGTQYVIYDPARKARAFLKVNERDGNLDVLVKQFDASNDMLTIEYQGRIITLEERKGKIVSSGSAAAMPPPQMPQQQPAPNVMPAVTQSVVVNPTPAEEQRRLEAVAAEVSRRRALREQAQQQVNQGGSPQVTVQPGQMPGDPQRRIQPIQPQMPQQMPPPGNPGGRANEVRQQR